MGAASSYVALGDSFSAGIGSGTPGTQCRRMGGYPVGVAARVRLDLTYVACNGATIGDVRAWQVDALTRETRLVTMTIGGNDAGFAEVLIACASPAWLADGLSVLASHMAAARRDLPGRLDGLYDDISGRAPSARIVTAGYPRLFAGSDCQPLTFFTQAEMRALNAAADELDGLMAAAAARHGAAFADPRGAFDGHGLCSRDAWINGLSWPIDDSFHPNRDGHAAYVDPVASAAAPGVGAPAPHDPAGVMAARPPRIVEGPRRRGSGARFALPDLTSPAALAAAARHGLNPEKVAEAARRLPRGSLAGGVPRRALDHGALEALRAMDADVRHRRAR